MSNRLPNITPGNIVPGGFTYPNNAHLVDDFLYLRDANGNPVSGHQVDAGDNITVLDVGYTKQLVLLQYRTPGGIRQGYVNNDTKIIKYFNQGQWHNGSTTETVYDGNDAVLGSLNPYETATPLYTAGKKTHVVYNTDKGANTKSGYVVYAGSSSDSSGSSSGSSSDNGGKTQSNAMDCIGDILYNMGFKGKLDTNIPLKFMAGNLEIDATIGSTSTITIGDGKVCNVSIKNGKPSFDLSDFPITEYIKLQSKLNEFAVKIGDGNISVALSSTGKVTIEIKIKLIDTPVYLTKELYCKIEISLHDTPKIKDAYGYVRFPSVELDWERLAKGFLVAIGVTVLGIAIVAEAPEIVALFVAKMIQMFGRIVG